MSAYIEFENVKKIYSMGEIKDFYRIFLQKKSARADFLFNHYALMLLTFAKTLMYCHKIAFRGDFL